MPTYIVLYNYTAKGMQTIKESPKRAEAVRQALQAVGGKLVADYLVMGEYDGVGIIEAPDDTTVARLLLQMGGQGNIQTRTLRAFTEAETQAILAAMD